ncbi:uncharacterized protein LOC143005500 [Genypterus blacodes]|uniref:uncharacterized protein LOC143005500 n=1 Tax=Genypterus blacodes TaxID=154954 RepID=UPI003F75AE08
MAVFRFMAEQLLLLIFIYSEVTVQALDAPNLAVSSTIITVTDHVTLSCEPPSYVSVERCYFYIDGTPAPFPDPSCKQTQPGTQLLFLANKSPPAEVNMSCFYTDNRRSPSPHSHKSSIMIQLSPRVITESDSVTLSCQTPSSAPNVQCYLYTARTGHIWRAPSCQQNFTGTELLQRSQQSSPAVVDMKCYYTVQQGSVTSPWSDISSITLQTVMTEISTYTTPAGGFGEAATSVPALEGSSHNKITENFEKNQTWRLVAFTAVCLMTVSISLLGSALIYHQIRTEKQTKRWKADITDYYDHGGANLPAGGDDICSVVIFEPVVDFPIV